MSRGCEQRPTIKHNRETGISGGYPNIGQELVKAARPDRIMPMQPDKIIFQSQQSRIPLAD